MRSPARRGLILKTAGNKQRRQDLTALAFYVAVGPAIDRADPSTAR
jgi:hypothetical protein